METKNINTSSDIINIDYLTFIKIVVVQKYANIEILVYGISFKNSF